MEIFKDVQDYLEDIDFPTTKSELIEALKMKGVREDIRQTFESLPEKTYETIEDITDYIDKSVDKITK